MRECSHERRRKKDKNGEKLAKNWWCWIARKILVDWFTFLKSLISQITRVSCTYCWGSTIYSSSREGWLHFARHTCILNGAREGNEKKRIKKYTCTMMNEYKREKLLFLQQSIYIGAFALSGDSICVYELVSVKRKEIRKLFTRNVSRFQNVPQWINVPS